MRKRADAPADLGRLNSLSPEAAAAEYLSLGLRPVPLDGKDPSVNGAAWHARAYGAADHRGRNVGLVLGPASGGLCDVDLDCAEAREIAPIFLPETPAKFGRESSPASHWIYLAEDPPDRVAYVDVARVVDGRTEKRTIAELRSSSGEKGFQTMAPPSVHPSSEVVAWAKGARWPPTTVPTADLKRAVARLSACALMARHLPAVGGRHDFALALAGALVRHGWAEEEAADFVWAACAAGGSDDPDKHRLAVVSTIRRISDGGPATGIPRLKEIVGDKAVWKLVNWLGLDAPPPAVGQGDRPDMKDDRPVVRITADEDEVIAQVIEAFQDAPEAYAHLNTLAEVICDEGSVDDEEGAVRRSPGASFVRQIPGAKLRSLVTRKVFLEKFDGRVKDYVHSHPTDWLVNGIAYRGDWPGLRALRAITDAPAFLANGRILSEAGWDRESGVYVTQGTRGIEVPDAPTRADATRAAARIADVVSEFPFVEDAHRASWVCSLLTVVSRSAFEGCAPLVLVEASTAGSGKSLLVDLVSTIAYGRPASRSSYSVDDEEMRKRITAAIRAGDRLVLFDNVENGSVMRSAALDRLLTSAIWQDRILGTSETFSAPVSMVLFASGNNLAIGGDLARRVMHVRLQPAVEQPEQQSGWKYPELLCHAKEIRAELLSAALTLLRAYHVAGRPEMGLTPWGSFEEWSALPRAATAWAGLGDPGEARGSFASMADVGRQAAADLVAEIAEMLGEREGVSAKEILTAAQLPKRARLKEAIEELCNLRPGISPTPRQVGYALRKIRGRVFGGISVDAIDRQKTHNLWRVVRSVKKMPTDE